LKGEARGEVSTKKKELEEPGYLPKRGESYERVRKGKVKARKEKISKKVRDILDEDGRKGPQIQSPTLGVEGGPKGNTKENGKIQGGVKGRRKFKG